MSEPITENTLFYGDKMITALRDFIGANQMMAYLVMMTARLELREISSG